MSDRGIHSHTHPHRHRRELSKDWLFECAQRKAQRETFSLRMAIFRKFGCLSIDCCRPGPQNWHFLPTLSKITQRQFRPKFSARLFFSLSSHRHKINFNCIQRSNGTHYILAVTLLHIASKLFKFNWRPKLVPCDSYTARVTYRKKLNIKSKQFRMDEQ